MMSNLRNRAIAFLLLAVMSAPLALLYAAPDPDNWLPPCCRRDGKHHCATMDAAMSRRAASLATRGVAAPNPCPMRNSWLSAIAPSQVGLPAQIATAIDVAVAADTQPPLRLARITRPASSNSQRAPPLA